MSPSDMANKEKFFTTATPIIYTNNLHTNQFSGRQFMITCNLEPQCQKTLSMKYFKYNYIFQVTAAQWTRSWYVVSSFEDFLLCIFLNVRNRAAVTPDGRLARASIYHAGGWKRKCAQITAYLWEFRAESALRCSLIRTRPSSAVSKH